MFDPAFDPPTFDQAVAAAATQGRGCHPEVSIPLPVFSEHAARVGTDVAGLLRHGADLYLACACAQGDRQALLLFEKLLLPAVDGHLRRMRVGAVQRDEIRQGLRVRLFSDNQPRIATYTGKGPLVAWLRMVATRLALNMVNLDRTEGARLLEDGVAIDRLIAAAPEPELEVIRARFRAEFQRALDESLAALTPRAKAVLRLHYLDGQNLEAIAALHGVHRATVARWLVGIRSTVLANLRDRLRVDLRPTSSDFRSLSVALKDQLSISVDRLLPNQGR